MVSQAVADHAQAIVTWTGVAPTVFDSLFARERAQGGVVATCLSIAVGDSQNQNSAVGETASQQAAVCASTIREGGILKV